MSALSPKADMVQDERDVLRVSNDLLLALAALAR
jgi:hypothetical protein